MELLSRFSFLTLLPIFYVSSVNCEEWWQYSTVYQIYPRSFQDSNGDGIGDLKGISQRLDHLSSFNGSIWLSPIYKSPMIDFGYDISDFTDIDPVFGTIADLQDLLEKAHSLGIKVVLDFIPNHSSDQHEWFQKSLQMEDPYTDFYVWADPKGFDQDGNPIPPSNWVARFRGSMWTFREERQQFYLHQYLVQQPDLNYKSPELKARMFDIIKFWMDLGVDGFRFDAVTKLVEDDRWLDEPSANDPEYPDPGDWLHYDHIYTNNLPETRSILLEFYDLVKTYKADTRSESRVVMLEAWLDINSTMEYYKCGDFPFNFGFVNMEAETPTAESISHLINTWLDFLPEGASPNWVLGNHDRKRIGTRLGHQYVDIFNLISMSLPGIAVVYYGEEIGMTDTPISFEDTMDPWGCNCGPENYSNCSRDPSRTPMQWSGAEENAGFSTANSTWLPVNENFIEVNLETEAEQEGSHWRLMQILLRLRQNSPSFMLGSSRIFHFDSNVLAIERGEKLISLINFGGEMVSLDLQAVFATSKQFVYIHFATSELHLIGGEYNSISFDLDAYEGVLFEFATEWQ